MIYKKFDKCDLFNVRLCSFYFILICLHLSNSRFVDKDIDDDVEEGVGDDYVTTDDDCDDDCVNLLMMLFTIYLTNNY